MVKRKPRSAKRLTRDANRIVRAGGKHIAALPDLARNQKRMVDRLKKAGVLARIRRGLRRCKPGKCGLNGDCVTACWFADRGTINEQILAAIGILKATGKCLHYVTIIDPHYDVPIGELRSVSLRAMMSSLRRRFREADAVLGGDPAYGFVEVALEVDVDGCVVWSPHVHIVIASDASAAQIRTALEPRRPVPVDLMRGRHKRKPIMVRPVDNLANALAYSGKRIPEANVGAIQEGGVRVRQKRQLTRPELLEYDRWLCGQRPADRIFKRKMKEVHGKLVPLR